MRRMKKPMKTRWPWLNQTVKWEHLVKREHPGAKPTIRTPAWTLMLLTRFSVGSQGRLRGPKMPGGFFEPRRRFRVAAGITKLREALDQRLIDGFAPFWREWTSSSPRGFPGIEEPEWLVWASRRGFCFRLLEDAAGAPLVRESNNKSYPDFILTLGWLTPEGVVVEKGAGHPRVWPGFGRESELYLEDPDFELVRKAYLRYRAAHGDASAKEELQARLKKD